MKLFFTGSVILSLGLFSFSAADETAPFTKTIKVETKNKKSWKSRDTAVITNKINEVFSQDKINKYGSWLNEKKNASGFFRVERDKKGRWWFIDPEGYPHINIAVNSVSLNKSKSSKELIVSMFGTKESWAGETVKLLRQNSFNSLGSWTDTETMRSAENPLPYTLNVNFMAGYSKKAGLSSMGSGHRDYSNDLIPVFDPEFENYCKKAAAKFIHSKNDPLLIGIFSDNELPFPFDILDRTLKLRRTDHAFAEAEKWLKENKIDRQKIDEQANLKFLQFVSERYFRICKEALAAALPNHLYIGCRFHGKTLRAEAVFKAAAKYLDVISVNWYGKWTPDKEKMDQWMQWSGRPFIITEFYAKGMDSGLANTSGAGWTVKTQEDRGHFYQNFVLALSRHQGNIGWHWFKYIDNDPDVKASDPSNKDANKGIVNEQFKPYTKMLDAMKVLNSRVYQIRNSGS